MELWLMKDQKVDQIHQVRIDAHPLITQIQLAGQEILQNEGQAKETVEFANSQLYCRTS